MGQSVLRNLYSSVCLQPLLSLSHKTYQSTFPVHPFPLSTSPALPHLCPTPSSFLTHFTPPSVTLQRATDLVRHVRGSSNSSWSCSFGSYKFVVVLFWRGLALDCIVHLNVTSWLMWILHYHNKFHYWQCILGLKALLIPYSLIQCCTVLYLINLQMRGKNPQSLGEQLPPCNPCMSVAKKAKSANSKVISPGNSPLHGPSTLQV